MRYVIIGNSAAAVGCVEGIRQIDSDSEIIMISNENYHTYSRPLISYLLLSKTIEEKMKYRDENFYKDNKCTLITGKAVREINHSAKNVLLDDGTNIEFDKLLVSTGSSAFVPNFDGLDTVNKKFTFMTLDDAKALSESIDEKSKVLIIGAGLIGLKCAEGILKRVAKVTVSDLCAKILSSILDVDGADIVQKHLEMNGVDFILSDSVIKFEKNTAIFNSGVKIDFDVVVLAVGVRPNVNLLQNIADIDKGIIINSKSETSVKDIYAAGDCTQTLDISCGENKVMALLPNAYMQGECAGINMAGGESSFEKAIPMNAIGFLGLHVITAGNYIGEVYKETKKNTYKRLYYNNNKLNGFILIGDVTKAGIYTNLIKDQTPLDTIDFELICEKAGLMAFSKNDRLQKLGGVIQ